MARFPNWAQAISGALFNAVQNEGVPDLEAPRRVVQQLGEWGSHLSRNAATHWGASLLAGQDCSFEDCEQDALAPCIGCGDPVCLAHSHVSFRAELLCDECVERSVGAPRKAAGGRPRGRPGAGARGRQPANSPEQQAMSYFGVTPRATFEDVTAIFRRRMQQLHPDRGGSAAEVAVLTGHYHTLKAYYEQRAA